MILTDSHAHLSMVAERLGAEEVRQLLRLYAEAGMAARREGRAAPLLLDPGVEPGDLPRRAALVGGNPAIRLAAGIWPAAAPLADPEGAMAELERSIETAARAGIRVAAIGECGPDYHHQNAGREAQLELFALQIRLARRLGLPLIVHSRDAAEDTLETLRREARDVQVIIHCFGYGPAEARAFLELGCFLSFAGNLSYKAAGALREALLLVPAERLLLETDAPYMNPEPRRGKPSSPRDIERTYRLSAELRAVTAEALAETVARNADRLFGEG